MSYDEFDYAGWSDGKLNELKTKSTAKRVIVCGGRDYTNAVTVNTVLSELHHRHGIKCVIQGGAEGADHLAKRWAERFMVPVEEYKANWHQHGKSAGPLRNQRMAERSGADLCVSFPGGKGTADMVRRAKGAGMETIEIVGP